CGHHNGPLILVEDHAPIPDAKPQPGASFQALHVAMSGRRELRQPRINATTHVGRKLGPLASTRHGENDGPHRPISHIAISWSRPHREIAISITVANDALAGFDL